MSYEIIRTSQFKKDYKLMQRRGKDKRKLEEILRILAISPYVSRLNVSYLRTSHVSRLMSTY